MAVSSFRNILDNLSHKKIDFSYFPEHDSICKAASTHNTPFFLTDTSIIKQKLQPLETLIQRHWGESYQFAYSFKTNYSIAQKFKFSLAEVVSAMEYKLAHKAGYSDLDIIFNGPYKQDFTSLLSKPITINLENKEELTEVLISSKNISARLGLRINTTEHPSRFGFNIESGEALDAISQLVSAGVYPSGLHFHLGSNLFESSIYSNASAILAKFISQAESKYNFQFKYIDFGGGFPSHGLLPGSHKQNYFRLENYVRAITRPLKKYYQPSNLPKLILEPGRYFADDSTVLVSRVISHRFENNHQTLVVDSTNLMLPSVWYHPLIVRGFSTTPITSELLYPTTIFGCSCQESDQLYQGSLPQLTLNDHVIFYAVGAYNQSQSADFIFPTPPSFFI
jgi:diaminopimelate decarboxylase